MAKEKHLTEVSNQGRAPTQKALLFEVAGAEHADQGKAGRTLRLAALSLEEIVRYMRTCHPDFEIAEVKIVGHIEVLSSSEYLG